MVVVRGALDENSRSEVISLAEEFQDTGHLYQSASGLGYAKPANAL